MEMNLVDVISHHLMIVGGIILCLLGLIGSVLNIWIFQIWSRCRRASNTPLYLLSSSIADLMIIGYSLTTRILFDGYQYSITKDREFLLCKLRYFVLHTCDLISLTCVCLATFDQYLISSRKVRLRQMSKTREETKWIICLVLCLIICHSIPLLIYYDVSNLGQCVINSIIYLKYYRYTFQIFLHGIIPILIFSFFALLTYQQLKTLQNRNRDKQYSRMLLLMSITIVASSIPYAIENIYYLIFSINSQEESSWVFFFHIISSLLFYVHPACSFYVYYFSTRNFRLQVRKMILCKTNLNQVNTLANVQRMA